MRRLLALAVLLLSACRALPADGGADGPAAEAAPRPVVAMTFNLRWANPEDGANRWEARREHVAEVIRARGPELLGTQEGLAGQMAWLVERFPFYELVGVHREGDRRGEFAGLLVDRRRFRVLDQATLWLSAEPATVASVGWDAGLPRTCTWARLEDRADGSAWLVLATHLDNQGVEARRESAALIARRMVELAPDLDVVPVLLLGDLNAGERSRPLAILREAGLADTFRAAHPEALVVGTYHGFLGRPDGEKVDYVLASGALVVLEAAIVRTAFDGRYPSDHFPVDARVVRR